MKQMTGTKKYLLYTWIILNIIIFINKMKYFYLKYSDKIKETPIEENELLRNDRKQSGTLKR